MNREALVEEIQILEELARRKARRKILSYYPDSGPLRRELYAKHLEFFRLGATFKQRLAMCANRVGKTEGMGGFEITCHLTGRYPDWWEGRRFDKPVQAWAAGETAKDVRDSIQLKLCGPITEIGTGLIPGDYIGRKTAKSGVPDAIDTIYVLHSSGGYSALALKSYDQKRESFQAADVDVLWLDEEPPLDIYTEAVTRTMTTSGLVLLTFTPLKGMSETVMQFLPDGEIKERKDGTKVVIMATWDDAPHLTESMKREMLDTYPPFQRDARSKGIPQLGAGAIYPVPESDLLVDPFELPAHFPRCFGMDVGWNFTAAIWGALDCEKDILYLDHEYKRGEVPPDIHASAIKRPGAWIPGVIDPASRGRQQKDGSQLVQDYKDLGLNLEFAQNAVEAGLYEVWQRMVTGRLKIFKTMAQTLAELRLYRRDEKGKVVKENDHLMDAMRYLVVTGLERAKIKPVEKRPQEFAFEFGNSGIQPSYSWMG